MGTYGSLSIAAFPLVEYRDCKGLQRFLYSILLLYLLFLQFLGSYVNVGSVNVRFLSGLYYGEVTRVLVSRAITFVALVKTMS